MVASRCSFTGAGVGHSFQPESKQISDELIAGWLPRRRPETFQFVTYTPAYGEFFDLRIDSLEKMYLLGSMFLRLLSVCLSVSMQNNACGMRSRYQRAEICGAWNNMRTSNVLVLKLEQARVITLDGQRLAGSEFYKQDQKWVVGLPDGLRKRTGLQVRHTFSLPTHNLRLHFKQAVVLCRAQSTTRSNNRFCACNRMWVRPPVDPSFGPKGHTVIIGCVGAGEDDALSDFRRDFARYLRGDVRVKRSREVTAEDVAAFNLILFGDPGTNAWIGKVLPRLPVTWTTQEIRIGENTFPAESSFMAMIYPNPSNPARYVVLNSGHTFPCQQVDDMHWFLHPRLADFAVLSKRDRAVLHAGYFDARWQPTRT